MPVLSGRVLSALRILCNARILTVGPGLKSGIKLRLDNPAQLGAELLCGAVAALAECSGPLVVISADTAISMMAVNAKQELVGGVILPGPQLAERTGAEYRPAAADRPCCKGSCIHSGQEHLFLLAERLLCWAPPACWTVWRNVSAQSLARRQHSYATGNLPIPIREACCTPILYRETLITDGLYRIWMKNKKDNSNPPGALKKKKNQNTNVFWFFLVQ